jgi:hypothetical protein
MKHGYPCNAVATVAAHITVDQRAFVTLQQIHADAVVQQILSAQHTHHNALHS